MFLDDDDHGAKFQQYKQKDFNLSDTDCQTELEQVSSACTQPTCTFKSYDFPT